MAVFKIDKSAYDRDMPKQKQKPGRVIMRIELESEAQKRFAALPADRGMTQLAVTSRLVEWLCRQPVEIQSKVLGHVATEAGELPKLILKKMAG